MRSSIKSERRVEGHKDEEDIGREGGDETAVRDIWEESSTTDKNTTDSLICCLQLSACHKKM